jgi:hypothetical protein
MAARCNLIANRQTLITATAMIVDLTVCPFTPPSASLKLVLSVSSVKPMFPEA